MTNTSNRAGDAVSEAYLNAATEGAPLRALAGFARTKIGAHAQQHIRIVIDPRSMSTVDAAGKRSIVPGEYTLSLGSAQPSEDAHAVVERFTITGSEDLPR